MGRVKDAMMTIEIATWEILERHLTETEENIIGQVAAETKMPATFVAPVVRQVIAECKENSDYYG